MLRNQRLLSVTPGQNQHRPNTTEKAGVRPSASLDLYTLYRTHVGFPLPTLCRRRRLRLLQMSNMDEVGDRTSRQEPS